MQRLLIRETLGFASILFSFKWQTFNATLFITLKEFYSEIMKFVLMCLEISRIPGSQIIPHDSRKSLLTANILVYFCLTHIVTIFETIMLIQPKLEQSSVICLKCQNMYRIVWFKRTSYRYTEPATMQKSIIYYSRQKAQM